MQITFVGWRVAVFFQMCRCFTLDRKLPYHGRQKSSQSGMYGSGAVQHDCVMCTQDMLQFGLKDLTIQSDRVEGHEAGMTCSSQLEFSYGVGLKLDSVDTKTFLGGAPTFPIDDIEIWAVQ